MRKYFHPYLQTAYMHLKCLGPLVFQSNRCFFVFHKLPCKESLVLTDLNTTMQAMEQNTIGNNASPCAAHSHRAHWLHLQPHFEDAAMSCGIV